jgi:hypothetical protein
LNSSPPSLSWNSFYISHFCAFIREYIIFPLHSPSYIFPFFWNICWSVGSVSGPVVKQFITTVGAHSRSCWLYDSWMQRIKRKWQETWPLFPGHAPIDLLPPTWSQHLPVMPWCYESRKKSPFIKSEIRGSNHSPKATSLNTASIRSHTIQNLSFSWGHCISWHKTFISFLQNSLTYFLFLRMRQTVHWFAFYYLSSIKTVFVILNWSI